MDIKKLAEKHNEYIIKQRWYFHQNPELSFQETETTKVLKEQLEEMGIPVITFPDYNGLIGVIKGGKPGKTVMLRSDIDALPIEEHSGEEFAAVNGKMHACGHDCHMAVLLGAAKILMDVKAEIQGEVRLLFQAAEESGHGAVYYIEHGILDDVDAIFGLHIWGTLDAPKFNLESGPRMASGDKFKITVTGKSAHGSAPHLGHDAIVAAASIVMNVQTFVSRVSDPLDTLVVNIGTVKGGQLWNIIPNHVEFEGIMRTYSRQLRSSLEDTMRKIVCGTAEALGCAAEFEYMPLTAPVINDQEDLNRIAVNAAISLYGEESLSGMARLTCSEDFSKFAEKIPGFFGFLGCRNESIGAIYPNHSDKFKVDEEGLHRGAALYAQFAVDYLNEKAGDN